MLKWCGMNLGSVLKTLLAGEDLSSDSAREVMTHFMSGQASPVEIASILTALQAKQPSSSELASFSQVMREGAVPVNVSHPTLVDTCGTGGGASSFNLSTAAAIIAAACGARVAKHGNRAVSSSCGSADVLEYLGVPVDSPPHISEALLQSVGIAFLFAPNHHPSMKHVGPVRRELGVRTVFNLLGPLANPSRARRQVIGVYDPRYVETLAGALVELGTDHSYVVHGENGLDEVNPCGLTRVALVKGRQVETLWLGPQDFGLEPAPESALKGGETIEESAQILKESISDVKSPRFLAVQPNAALVLVASGVTQDLREGAALAREAVASGSAAAKLSEWVAASS